MIRSEDIIPWQSITSFPDDMRERAMTRIKSYNRTTFAAFAAFGGLVLLITLVIFAKHELSVPGFILMNLGWDAIMALLWYIRKMDTGDDEITAVEDTVESYTPARGYGKYYTPPFVRTSCGADGTVYEKREYFRGERVYIVRCGRLKAHRFCMPYDE